MCRHVVLLFGVVSRAQFCLMVAYCGLVQFSSTIVFTMACVEQTMTFIISSPIGDIDVIVCENGVHSINQNIKTDEDFSPDLGIPVEIISLDMPKRFSKRVDDVASWFKRYFENPHLGAQIGMPVVCMNSLQGKFYKNVWMQLASNVHAGQTITYGELAQSVGSVGGAQAVGQAMACNPLQIIVPCHRVVLKSQKLGNYSRGKKNSVKRWLLNFEGCKSFDV